MTLETRGTMRDWSTCGRDIVTGTSGKIGKIFIQPPSTAPAKKPGCDLHGLRKQKKCGWAKLIFFLSFHDAICKCLKSKEMFCSQLTRAWAPQRCWVLWRRMWVPGSISPSDLEAPWHRGHCWGLLPIALKWLGKPQCICPAFFVAAWGILGLSVAPFRIWHNKCNDLKHPAGQEPKGEKGKGCLRGLFRNRAEPFFLRCRKMLGKYLHKTKWTVSYCMDTGGGSYIQAYISSCEGCHWQVVGLCSTYLV